MPWFWAERGEWYVTIKKVRHRLGPDKTEADRQFHLLMAGEAPEPVAQKRDWVFASEVADRFQTALKNERSASTLDWYCQYLDPFKERFMNARADTLPADAVRDWVNGKWSSQPSRRAAIRSVKAAFQRAMSDGLIPSCPVLSIKLPGETNRDLVVSKKQYEKVLSAVEDKNFADLIRFVWMSGARPQEAVLISDSHIDVKKSRIVLPIKEAKGKKRPRVIYLTAELLKLLKPRMGNGVIFRTKRGEPFNKDIVRQRFRTLETKLGTRYCLYHFRHGFAHRALAAGNDALTVATLMGHNSTQTLAKVYAHLNQADGHLRAALRKAK
ncbi:MAG: tyrosine-type recombinase/integrase [Pirellulales bacterium]